MRLNSLKVVLANLWVLVFSAVMHGQDESGEFQENSEAVAGVAMSVHGVVIDTSALTDLYGSEPMGERFPLDDRLSPIRQGWRPPSHSPAHFSGVEHEAIGGVNNTRCFVTKSFTAMDQLAIDGATTAWFPPDPMIAVSQTHIVEVVNGKIAFYSKAISGEPHTPLLVANLGNEGAASGFFEPVGAQQRIFDPKVVFDAYEDRFVVVGLEWYVATGPSLKSYVYLAVSDDANPEGVWFLYRTQVTSVRTGLPCSGGGQYNAGSVIDYPGIAVNSDTVVISGNLFVRLTAPPCTPCPTCPIIGSFMGTLIRVFDKASLTTTTAVFQDIAQTGDTVDPANIQPAQSMDEVGAPTPVLVVNAQYDQIDSTKNKIRIGLLGKPDGTTWEYVRQGDVSVPPYYFIGAFGRPGPAGVQQLGTPKLLDAADGRIINAVSRTAFDSGGNPTGGSIYAAHAVYDSAVDRIVARWYEFGFNLNAPPYFYLLQACDIDMGEGTGTFFPTVALNSLNELAIVFARSGPLEYPSFYVAARGPGDLASTIGLPTLVKDGVFNFTQGSTTVARWGDYFGIAVEPKPGVGFGARFWCVGEWSIDNPGSGPTELWQTTIAQFRVLQQ